MMSFMTMVLFNGLGDFGFAVDGIHPHKIHKKNND